MKGITEEITTETFDNFINASGHDKTKAKYKPFMDRITILRLNVNDKEELLHIPMKLAMRRASVVT
jgi:5-hydroxyisourate hydrolase-like protein (transthyretin family)